MSENGELDGYFDLVRANPELFLPRSRLSLVLDRPEMEEFVARTQQRLGVVYASRYVVVCVDLVADAISGRRFPYVRVLSTGELRGGRGVVVIPRVGADTYVLIAQERHSTGRVHLEFPRGFAEPGTTAEQLAVRETREELGVEVVNVQLLGRSVADSGISASQVAFIVADIRPGDRPVANETQIVGVESLSFAQLVDAVASGVIDDGFTIQAVALLLIQNREALRPSGRSDVETPV